ncbi:Death-on-curing protein [Beggiatoa sp. PS]|nr:Death-on-curing protein [Beggiatoa sp. PS]
MPKASFDGQFLHTDLYAMAAAYLFHIVKNHPFVDGNKRIGTFAAFSFFRPQWN